MTSEVCQGPDHCTQCKSYKKTTRPLPGKWDGAIMVGGSDGGYENQSANAGDEQHERVLQLYFSGRGPEKPVFFRLLLALLNEFFPGEVIHVLGMDVYQRDERLGATNRLKLHDPPPGD